MINSRIVSWGKFLIGWPLSIVSLFFIFKLIVEKGSKLNLEINQINLSYITISVLIFFCYYILRSFLWLFLLKEKGEKISFKENTYRFTFSELKRYAPGNIWSFLGRAHQFSEIGIDKKTVGIALFADIQLVIIGCALASIPAIPWLLNSSPDLQTKVLTLLPLSLFTIFAYFGIIAFLYKKKYDKNASWHSSAILPGYPLNSKIKLIALSTITYFIFGLGNYLAMLSVNFIDFSNTIYISSFFVFSLLIGYLSFITPMGLGIREGIVTLGLTKIMNIIDAGFISIFTRIVLILSELSFLVLIFLWEKLPSKK